MSKYFFVDESGISNINEHTSFAFVGIEVHDLESFNLKLLEIEKKLNI